MAIDNRTTRLTIAGLIFGVALLFMAAFRQYYTWNRPEQPDISTNRIVPVSLNYNRTVYVTRIEAEIISISNVTLVIFGVGALIVYVANSRPRNQETSNKSED